MDENEILGILKDAVVKGDEKLSTETAKVAIENKMDAYKCIKEGLSEGMAVISDKYDKREVFVPQILRSARAMNMAVDLLKPYLKAEDSQTSGTVVLGVVQGDIHDIGKNLVKLLCEAAGVNIIDLGKSVSVEKFVETAKESNADIVGMSSLMTTSMIAMPDVIKAVRESLPDCKIIIGGGAVSQGYADKIGADGYADDAAKALKLVESILEA